MLQDPYSNTQYESQPQYPEYEVFALSPAELEALLGGVSSPSEDHLLSQDYDSIQGDDKFSLLVVIQLVQECNWAWE